MDGYVKQVIDINFDNPAIRNTLYTIIPQIIAYYGPQCVSLVAEALRNIKIYVYSSNENITEFIESKLGFSFDSYMYTIVDEIKMSSCLSITEHANVVYNTTKEDFETKGYERKIIFCKASLLKQTTKQDQEDLNRILIHTLCEKIKSIKNNNIIRSGRKINRCGLQQSFSKLEVDPITEEVEVTFLSETGKGISQAIMEYDTQLIFRNMFHRELNNPRYTLELSVIKKIFQNEALFTLFHDTELDGDIPYLRTFYDSCHYDSAYDKLVQLLDEVANSNYTAIAQAEKEMMQKIEEYLQTLSSQEMKKIYEG